MKYQITAHRLCMAYIAIKNEVCNSILSTKMLNSIEKIVMLTEKTLSCSSTVTGILILEKLVQGPKSLLKKMSPDHFLVKLVLP